MQNLMFNINFKGNYEKKEQITFGIGGSGKDKKWDINYFIELGILLNEKKYLRILIAGGKNETQDADYIIKHLKSKNIETISLCDFDIKSTLPSLLQAQSFTLVMILVLCIYLDALELNPLVFLVGLQ